MLEGCSTHKSRTHPLPAGNRVCLNSDLLDALRLCKQEEDQEVSEKIQAELARNTLTESEPLQTSVCDRRTVSEFGRGDVFCGDVCTHAAAAGFDASLTN